MPIFKALICQFLAFVCVFLAANKLPFIHHPVVFLLAQTLLAAGASRLIRQPIWWVFIHLLFLPSIFLFFTFHVSPIWYLAVALLMLLIFWGTIRGDVPLFLSSDEVAQTVCELLKKENATKFADLGAGVGSVAIPVAAHFSTVHVEAWENAPLPFLLSIWRGRKLANYQTKRENFFNANFGDYEVIFAFLSPAAMPQVSEKIKREMKAGTLFISSSFPAPNWKPERVLQLKDFRKTVLYCYRI
jgi:hypothetical protein